ncbi:RNA polymerase sigma factor ShbA [Amycolatopsis palatopharyngis]|uniref:RNA polymerase sigma factor ShbA n=1 Tax=Amycolatopsis palatopharyngis TaxID=187982 RepID=UPI000E24D8CD|nr:RNA polymerase sigma factor ShbA [Amycolatopsis palatopharyngis]
MAELDDDVVRRATRGERDAAAELLTAIRPGVLRYCWARLGPPGTTHVAPDDVAQEVCLAVFQALRRYQDRGLPFAAFVYGIAANKVADAHRAAARFALVRPVDTVAEPADEAPGPERHAVAADMFRRVTGLLQHLPETQREIIALRVAAGLSADEVGAVLGMTPSAVRMAQSRALARLREWTRDAAGEVLAL